jgi:HEAT repeat protein
MNPRAAAWSVALGLAATTSTQAGAQARPGREAPIVSTPTAGSATTTSLRGRFGTDIATRLVRSSDADERLRGIERVAAIHTPEALALLERAGGAGVPGAVDPRTSLDGIARSDPRALLVVVRGLAAWLDHEQARAALASIVAAPSQSFATRAATIATDDPSADDAEGAARVLLARQEAAIALAESGNTLAVEALIALARSAGPGQAPALDGLAIHPPAPALLGGVVLTTAATVALAVAVGDLRALDAIEAAMNASDPALRAAALVALGVAGDSRILGAARTALHDRDPRVRLAAGDALARLGAPDAAQAVEGLIGDDATALDALRLAQLVEGEGVTKATAARAAASANANIRSAALAALGRQTSPLAIGALAAFVAEPTMQGDAACAMARSPSSVAMAALETMGDGTAPMRRLAARTYFMRRLMRQERSIRLDDLLVTLSASDNARDRAVGVQALVALGERLVARALQDVDPRVRRAAAMGAVARRDAEGHAALLARMVVETDEVTRQVLALGLEDGDANRVVPTMELSDRARAGGPDAPFASLAIAQRADELRSAEVDALLQSRDPVLRAHVARGLATSVARNAAGRLARAYAKEGDVEVRRAIISALSARTGEDASAPERRDTLELAARFDPDRLTRWTASLALSGTTQVRRRPLVQEVVWLRLIPAQGATLPQDMTASLVQSDGLALPIAFDEDGYALVPGVPPGDARLRLAPRPPAYEASSP